MELIVHPVSAFAFENLKSQSSISKKDLIPLSSALTAGLSGVILTLICLIPFLSNVFNTDANHIRSLIITTILYGNIGFTIIEAWPSIFTRRIGLIITILLVLPILLCNLESTRQMFYFDNLSFAEIVYCLIGGLMASMPSFLLRHYFVPKNLR